MQFEPLWMFSEIPSVRTTAVRSTYHAFDYQNLPPIEATLDGSFNWLRDRNEPQVESWDTERWANYIAGVTKNIDSKTSALKQQADRLGLAIPQAYLEFIKSQTLIRRIRSNTDCGFESTNRIAPNPFGNGHLILFLIDSQCCCEWSIFLGDDGYNCIVVSWGLYWYLCDEFDDCENPFDEDCAIHYCAPDFESFVYRFWLENEIWFQVTDGLPLNPLQLRYSEHYRGLDG